MGKYVKIVCLSGNKPITIIIIVIIKYCRFAIIFYGSEQIILVRNFLDSIVLNK